MKTTKKPLLTTTTSSLDYHYELFEYDDVTAIEKSRNPTSVDFVFSIFGFFVCFFHFFILTRKGLRNEPFYIFLLIICICDFCFFSGKLTWSIWDFTLQNGCSVRSSFHQHIRVGIMVIQSIARNATSTLTVIISVLKMISEKIKVTHALLLSTVALGCCMAWHVWSSLGYEFLDMSASGCTPNPSVTISGAFLSIDPEHFQFQKFINEFITIILTIFLATCTVILFLKLRTVVKTRNGEDDLIVLLFLLTFSVFLSEFLDLSVVLFDKFLLKPYENIQTYFVRFQVVVHTITTINTATHSFICLLTSSEYFDISKKYMCRRKTPKLPAPDAPSVSTIRVTNGSDVAY